MKLEHYIMSGGKRLRCGYTTGTCAAGATRLAAEALLTGHFPASVRVETPSGIVVELEPEACRSWDNGASCGVRKDAGDDVDVTDGTLIVSTVTRTEQDIIIDGGQGIGRVTRPGLDQPVGAAAINSTPRKMIEEQARQALASHGARHGLQVVISAPEGQQLAQKTFNPRLGIEGGFSILGTTGIVRPMSRQAIVDTTRIELDMLYAAGIRDVILSPGNYGVTFGQQTLGLGDHRVAECSNYIGEALDHCRGIGMNSVLLVGHVGKLCKLAAGVFDTHSRTADGRREVFVTAAALSGGGGELLRQLYDSPTTDACLELLSQRGLMQPVMDFITAAIEQNIKRRGDPMTVEAVVFSRVHGLLGKTSGAEALMDCLKKKGQ